MEGVHELCPDDREPLFRDSEPCRGSLNRFIEIGKAEGRSDGPERRRDIARVKQPADHHPEH